MFRAGRVKRKRGNSLSGNGSYRICSLSFRARASSYSSNATAPGKGLRYLQFLTQSVVAQMEQALWTERERLQGKVEQATTTLKSEV